MENDVIHSFNQNNDLESNENKKHPHFNAGLIVNGKSDPSQTIPSNNHSKSQPLNGDKIAHPCAEKSKNLVINNKPLNGDPEYDEKEEQLLKPLGNFLGYTGEWKILAQTISQEIMIENLNVKWKDIIGLDYAKQLIKEAIVYPIKYPDLFVGILSPWKGLLLYGPPGTGKTLLAKAIATECKTTFFNISASTIVSKWRGDSEKLVRVLFELARFHAPSTIFLDELDSLMSQRGSLSGCGTVSSGKEHEGSLRMKTELLIQMDGLAKTNDLVFLLAASNLPWELDHAMLRRLEKRILVDLPNQEARKAMFETFLPSDCNRRHQAHSTSTSSSSSSSSTTSTTNNTTNNENHRNKLNLKCQIDYELVSRLTEGYSGSDIHLVCKEAAMRVVRKIFSTLETSSNVDLLKSKINLDPVTTEDVKSAIQTTMPSAGQLAGKYLDWKNQFGSS